jgi:hypothetical protein
LPIPAVAFFFVFSTPAEPLEKPIRPAGPFVSLPRNVAGRYVFSLNTTALQGAVPALKEIAP